MNENEDNEKDAAYSYENNEDKDENYVKVYEKDEEDEPYVNVVKYEKNDDEVHGKIDDGDMTEGEVDENDRSTAVDENCALYDVGSFIAYELVETVDQYMMTMKVNRNSFGKTT